MFGLFKKQNAAPATNGLFLVTVKVARGSNTEMPAQLVGAYVPVYAAAANHELAVKAAAAKLVSLGFEFLDIHGSITQLDPLQWSNYVRRTWPEFVAHLPGQQAVVDGLATGTVFIGPFAGYEAGA